MRVMRSHWLKKKKSHAFFSEQKQNCVAQLHSLLGMGEFVHNT